MSLNQYDEGEEIEKKDETINNYEDLFTPYINNPPSLKEALIHLFTSSGLDQDKANDMATNIISICDERIEQKLSEIKSKYPEISFEDAKIIASYTCESSYSSDYSPYRLLNRNLVSDNRKQGLQNVSKYFFILLKSLRKLTRFYPDSKNKYLYRCIDTMVNYKIDPFKDNSVPYLNGNTKTFWGFTSTSPKIHTSYSFLQGVTFKKGTVFTISGDVWGYDISLFNTCNEKEILLEPERKIYIKETKPPVMEILYVTCKVLETPLVLDKIIKIEHNINTDSKILEFDNKYKKYLIRWLEKPNNDIESQNVKDIELLYRGSRDGFEAHNFHDKCDNQGQTLTIIKSSDDFIFGGYTEINWDSTTWNGKVGEGNNARREGKGNEFVYTLKNPHNISPSKFNMKKEWLNHSICCDVNLGPIFGCNDIRIENNCNTKNNSFSFYDFEPGEYCFDDNTGKKRLLFTGKKSFTVKEIEVFKITR